MSINGAHVGCDMFGPLAGSTSTSVECGWCSGTKSLILGISAGVKEDLGAMESLVDLHIGCREHVGIVILTF